MNNFQPRPGGARSRAWLSRRQMLAGLAASSLAACSTDRKTSSATGSPQEGRTSGSTADPGAKGLVWAQWPGYIDKDESEKKRPTLDAFIAETGIKVEYREVINDNVEYLDGTDKTPGIRPKLEAKQPIGADVVTLTTWLASRLVRADLMQPILPAGSEAGGKVISALARPDFDPEQRYTMPWQAGITGIAYDARKVDRAIGSLDELFTRSDLKGRVGILTEFADTAGIAMLALGKDLGAGSVVDAADGVDYLQSLNEQGWFGGYYGNNFVKALDKEKVVATLAWSGDTIQAQFENPFMKFVIPEEGAMIWADNLMMPKASKAAGAAAKLVEYYYQPEVAAQLAAYVNYICPVDGAQEAMLKVDPDLAENPLIFPNQSLLDRCYQYPTLPIADDDALRAQFDKIINN
ncbi:MAG: ABC transporter substrate-binding protein [Nocardioides sp.]